MHQDDKPWRALESKIMYSNSWMKVYEDKIQMPNGNNGIYGFVEGGSGVFIIALNSNDEMYLVESFRYPNKKWQWELPTGGIDAHSTPLEAAKGELKEELGLTAKKWTALGIYGPSHNGFMKDEQYVYVAEELTEGKQKLGDFEAIRSVKTVALNQLIAMIQDGDITDGQSLAALMKYMASRSFRV